MTLCVCLCIEVRSFLKRDEEEKIKKDRGVHLVDWSDVGKARMCGRDIWA